MGSSFGQPTGNLDCAEEKKNLKYVSSALPGNSCHMSSNVLFQWKSTEVWKFRLQSVYAATEESIQIHERSHGKCCHIATKKQPHIHTITNTWIMDILTGRNTCLERCFSKAAIRTSILRMIMTIMMKMRRSFHTE